MVKRILNKRNRIRKMARVSLAIMLLLVISSCGTKAGVSPLSEYSKKYTLNAYEGPAPNAGEPFINDINDFGFHALGTTNKLLDPCENRIISPLSLSVALALAGNGAEGETKNQIDNLINAKNLLPQELNEGYFKLISHLNNREDVKIGLANSLWVGQQYSFTDEFVKTAKSFYNSDVFNVDFKAKDAVSLVNNWISQKTEGFIKNPVDRLDPETITLLINTLYFKGSWVETFNASMTQKDGFIISSGENIQVDMMNKQSDVKYYEDEALKAIQLSYHGDASMLFIRPEGDLNSIVQNMSSKNLYDILEKMSYCDVKMRIPKFEFTSSVSMVECLKDLGMVDAFGQNAAFNALIKQSDKKVYLDDIQHDCKIELDEEGTVAAAVTTMIFGTTSAQTPLVQKEFYLDKPFMFILLDNQTRVALFIGQVENPNSR